LDTPQVEDLDEEPLRHGTWWQSRRLPALASLGETAQPIFVLHHALAAFPQWPLWSDLVGIPYAVRAYPPDCRYVGARVHFDQTIQMEITDPEHFITRGLPSWDLAGEAWSDILGDPSPDSHVLLQARHPQMQLTAMAWTRRFRRAPVFCLQPGHDAATWDDPNYRMIVERACHWLVA
jgi:hypothetical protein